MMIARVAYSGRDNVCAKDGLAPLWKIDPLLKLVP